MTTKPQSKAACYSPSPLKTVHKRQKDLDCTDVDGNGDDDLWFVDRVRDLEDALLDGRHHASRCLRLRRLRQVLP